MYNIKQQILCRQSKRQWYTVHFDTFQWQFAAKFSSLLKQQHSPLSKYCKTLILLITSCTMFLGNPSLTNKYSKAIKNTVVCVDFTDLLKQPFKVERSNFNCRMFWTLLVKHLIPYFLIWISKYTCCGISCTLKLNLHNCDSIFYFGFVFSIWKYWNKMPICDFNFEVLETINAASYKTSYCVFKLSRLRSWFFQSFFEPFFIISSYIMLSKRHWQKW